MRKGHSISPMLSGRWILWRIAVSFSFMGNLFRNRVIQIKIRPPNHSMRLDVHSDIQYFMFIYLFLFLYDLFWDDFKLYNLLIYRIYLYCILCFLFLSTFFIFVETSLHSYLHIFHYKCLRGYILNGLFMINLDWVGDLSFLFIYHLFLNSFHRILFPSCPCLLKLNSTFVQDLLYIACA